MPITPVILWKQPQVCERFCFHGIISTPICCLFQYQFVLKEERADDITKCELVTQPVLVSQAMRDGVLKSVCDEEQRIKHIEEMEQKCIQVCDCVCNHWLGSKLT